MKILNQLLITGFFIFGIFFQAAMAQTEEVEQPVYKISGKVTEKGSDEPVPYAAVSLLEAEGGKSIAGAVADFDGEFIITNFGDGKYQVVISFMGYETFSTPVLTISESNPTLSI
jgi:hypothetical protein